MALIKRNPFGELEKEDNKDNKENYSRVERHHGPFVRSFSLSPSVDQGKIEVKMEKGLLKVKLLKREETKPKQIEVKLK